jgi:hypothetical protein
LLLLLLLLLLMLMLRLLLILLLLLLLLPSRPRLSIHAIRPLLPALGTRSARVETVWTP